MRWFFMMCVLVLAVSIVSAEPVYASSGGGLPYESALTKIKDSVTGPVAFTLGIVGIVGAGAMLIFGGDTNGFLRTLCLIVLVLSFLVAANNVLTTLYSVDGATMAVAGVSELRHV